MERRDGSDVIAAVIRLRARYDSATATTFRMRLTQIIVHIAIHGDVHIGVAVTVGVSRGYTDHHQGRGHP